MLTRKPAALSPSRRVFLLVACLRYNWGDRVGQAFLPVKVLLNLDGQECLSYFSSFEVGSPPALSPSLAGSLHTGNREGHRSLKTNKSH